jgi:hypothetical protein
MTTETNLQNKETNRAGRGWVGGLILILIGGLALLAQFVDISGLYVLPVLSACFLVWGILSRQTGLVIPGGILGGIGLGAFLVEGPFAYLGDPATGGVFMLAFACGWALITLVSIYTNRNGRPSLWPLIPGGIMAAIGAILLAGGKALTMLNWLNFGWPVILIAVGLYLILRRKELVD